MIIQTGVSPLVPADRVPILGGSCIVNMVPWKSQQGLGETQSHAETDRAGPRSRGGHGEPVPGRPGGLRLGLACVG